MTTTTKQTQLEAEIKQERANYDSGNQSIPDEVYDNKEKELEAIAPDSPVLAEVGVELSPTSIWEKVKHSTIIGSLDKVTEAAELTAWMTRQAIDQLILMLKYDGLSVEAVFADGELIQAITRGDGITGDDITANVRRIPSAVCTDKNFTGILRGEIIMLKEVFETKYSKDYVNARNLAAGMVKSSPEKCVPEDLEIFFYDILGEHSFTDRQSFLCWESRAFSNAIYFLPLTKDTDLSKIIKAHRILREGTPFNIDGLVFRDRFTWDEHKKRPDKAIAFKFEAPMARTTITDIEWTNTGKAIAPVAVLEPVFLVDSTVSRASVHNIDWMRERGIRPGVDVTIKKGGDIIPCVHEVCDRDTEIEQEEATWSFIPRVCPCCGAAVEKKNSNLVCTSDDCPMRNERMIKKLVRVLDVNFVGEKLVKQIAAHYTWEDILNIIKSDDTLITFMHCIADYPRMGIKSAEKVIHEFMAKREITVLQAIWMLDIDNFSSSRIQYVIDAGYDTIGKIKCMTVEDFQEIPGFGTGEDSIACTIVQAIQDSTVQIANIRDAFAIKNPQSKVVASTDVEQFTFTLTGALSVGRGTMSKLIKDAGHKVSNSLTSSVDYLVTGVGPYGAKHRKADKLGIPKLTEAELYEKIGHTK